MQRQTRRSRIALLRRAGVRGQHVAVVVGIIVAMVLACGVGLARSGMLRPGLVVRRAQAVTTQAGDAAETVPEDGSDAGEVAALGEEGAEVQAQAVEPQRVTVVVHVDGAVAMPGVYEVTSDCPRVIDAVTQAGGLAEGADTTGVNLAAPLTDGQKVYVPQAGEPAPEGSGGLASWESSSPSPKVNINTASVEELQALSGIGEVTARAIVEERERGGPFSAPEDLMRVSGIGEKKYERIAGDICV